MKNIKKKILIVEDEHSIALDFSLKIKKLGYNTVIETTGRKAIDRVLDNDDIDLIIQDINLGDSIDGIEVAKTILKHKELPIIFCSVYSDKDTLNKIKQITKYGFIPKNLSDYLLEPTIDMALKLYEANMKLKNKIIELDVLTLKQKAILEAIPDIIMQVDNNKVYTWSNDAGYKFFGDDVIGKEASYYFEGNQNVYNKIFPIFLGEDNVSYVESWQRRKDSEIRLLAWWCRALKNSAGKVIGAISSARDITEQKEAEETIRHQNEELRAMNEELDAANKQLLITEKDIIEAKEIAESSSKAKSEFLANMSHEIRTPLNGIIGFIDLLFNTPLNNTQKQYLKNVNTSTKTLLGIINDILDFSKIESGKLELDYIETDLVELVEKSTDILKYYASKKKIELLVNIPFDVPRFAIVDPLRLQQILVNLLSNSLKFTAEGEVELKVNFKPINTKKGLFTFAVKDTGIGISLEDQKKLFEAFTQADSSTTRKYGGTGLGLTISNKIAEKMNSKIYIKSKVNEGSEFFFTIETEYKQSEKMESSNLKDIKRVLIIDDNYSVRKSLEYNFKYWGIESVSVENCENGLKTIKKNNNFDIVIVDYNMPDIDGLETIKKIKKIPKISEKKIIFILLHNATEDIDFHNECKKLGVKFYLIKPIKMRKLFYLLKNINLENISDFFSDEIQYVKTDSYMINNKKGKILIAEDLDLNMALIEILLKYSLPNFEVLKAYNGKEAYDIAISKKPDIIFMDVQMPVMNGIEATEKIRKYEKNQDDHSIIIALTAGALKSEKEKCLKAGMNDFYTKPLDRFKLQKILLKYFSSEEENNIDLDTFDNLNNNKNSDAQHFDKAIFRQKINNNNKIYKDIIMKALYHYPIYFKELKNAIDNNDLNQLKNSTHKIKGSVSFFNLDILSELIDELRYNYNSSAKVKKELYNQIINEWKNVKNILAKE
jgi:PAS domain S-box-containing protein